MSAKKKTFIVLLSLLAAAALIIFPPWDLDRDGAWSLLNGPLDCDDLDASLARALAEYYKQEPETEHLATKLDNKLTEQLRSLGYIGD